MQKALVMRRTSMQKLLVLSICIFSIILLLGCNDWQPRPIFYKNIESKEYQLPNSCEGSQNDACTVYSCLTPNCWCKESPDAILSEGNSGMVIETEEQAKQWMNSVLIAKNLSDNSFSVGNVTSAVKINSIFYNVFVEDEQGNETVYSVAIDGAIIETVCGV